MENTEPKKNNMNRLFMGIGFVSLLIVGAFLLLRNNTNPQSTTSEQTEPTQQTEQQINQVTQGPTTIAEDGSQVKTFTIEAKNFSFSIEDITVKKGDRVKIVLVNKEGFHDWVNDLFNARTEQINAGQTAEVEFVADQVGTSEYYCSVGKHRQMGMVGNLIVEE